MVTPLARAGVAVGADGIMVEVHSQPDEALSDGAQALTLAEFEDMSRQLQAIHDVVGTNNGL
jgi:3-deoxy-7-phosphoheptulonate synthase